jgi:hypothetical protein
LNGTALGTGNRLAIAVTVPCAHAPLSRDSDDVLAYEVLRNKMLRQFSC